VAVIPTLHFSARSGIGQLRRRPVFSLLAILAAACWLSGCGAHPGGDEIAFVRDGQLWTVNSDGSAAVELAQGGVVGFAWSPDHHQLVLRYTGKAPSAPANGIAPDGLSELAVTGVDGGSPVQITPQVSDIARSDAWWDASGNRLLYREGFPAAPGQEPTSVVYVLSQADQPAGLARKPLLDVAALPAVAPDGAQVAVLDAEGDVRVGKPGAAGQAIASGALLTVPGGTRPARLLWRPAHSDLLYATSGPSGGVRLVLSTVSGRTESTLDLANVTDYAFAPDGNSLLVQSAQRFDVWPLSGNAFARAPLFSWREADATTLAWWSPTSRAVLVQGQTGYTLANIAARQVSPLLRTAGGAPLPDAAASWHPLAGSPWNASGDAFVFRDSGSGTWRGMALATPHGAAGLYVGRIADSSALPMLIHSGNDWAPSWSYLPPGASWLAPS
jgi:hypothetical protein